VQFSERCSTYVYYDGELGRQNYQSSSVTGGIRLRSKARPHLEPARRTSARGLFFAMEMGWNEAEGTAPSKRV